MQRRSSGIPVLLLTPGKSSPLSEDCLKRIGDNVHQVIASESAHWIHLDEPQLLIDSIQQMVTAAFFARSRCSGLSVDTGNPEVSFHLV